MYVHTHECMYAHARKSQDKDAPQEKESEKECLLVVVPTYGEEGSVLVVGEERRLLSLGRHTSHVSQEPLADLTRILAVVEKEEQLAVFWRVKVHLWVWSKKE